MRWHREGMGAVVTRDDAWGGLPAPPQDLHVQLKDAAAAARRCAAA